MAGPLQLGVMRLVEKGLVTVRQAVRLKKVVGEPGGVGGRGSTRGVFAPRPLLDAGRQFPRQLSPFSACHDGLSASIRLATRNFYEHCWIPAFKGVRVQSFPRYGPPPRPDSYAVYKFRIHKGRNSNFRSIRLDIKKTEVKPPLEWKPTMASGAGFHHGQAFTWSAPLFHRALAGELDDELRGSRGKTTVRPCVASRVRGPRVLDSIEAAKIAKWAGRATSSKVKIEDLMAVVPTPTQDKPSSSSIIIDEAVLDSMSATISSDNTDWSPSAIERRMNHFFAPSQARTNKCGSDAACYMIVPLEPDVGALLVQDNIDDIGLFGPRVMQAIDRIGDAYERHHSRLINPMHDFVQCSISSLGRMKVEYAYLDNSLRREYFMIVHFEEHAKEGVLEAMQDSFSRERYEYYKQFLQTVEPEHPETEVPATESFDDLDPRAQGFGAGSRQSLDDLGAVRSGSAMESSTRAGDDVNHWHFDPDVYAVSNSFVMPHPLSDSYEIVGVEDGSSRHRCQSQPSTSPSSSYIDCLDYLSTGVESRLGESDDNVSRNGGRLKCSL